MLSKGDSIVLSPLGNDYTVKEREKLWLLILLNLCFFWRLW